MNLSNNLFIVADTVADFSGSTAGCETVIVFLFFWRTGFAVRASNNKVSSKQKSALETGQRVWWGGGGGGGPEQKGRGSSVFDNQKQNQNQSRVACAHFPALGAGCTSLLQILTGSLSSLCLL